MEPWLKQLIDTPAFAALIARAKETGVVTFDEVCAVLPPDLDPPEPLVAVADWLSDQIGIVLV
ncbi:MAG: hypothetical protein K2V38_27305, partial [Gemmataceae bacterium]|nr:hypothetical protein [Gemmataceae bacterium]